MSETHIHDQALSAELTKLVEPARSCFEHYALQERSGKWLEAPKPDLQELVKPVLQALEIHPVFKVPQNRYFGEKQLAVSLWAQSRNILRYVVDFGPAEAVAWLHRVYASTTCDLRLVAEVYGLRTEQRLELSNGTSLLPLSQLLPSANAAAILSQFEIRPGVNPVPVFFTGGAPIGATFTIRGLVAQEDFERASNSAPFRTGCEEFEETIMAMTLVGVAAPVIGTTWTEFTDPDLARAEFGRAYRPPRFEGLRVVGLPVSLEPSAGELVEKYLTLGPETRKICRIALERLNLARRRTTPGNKAIEGSICLESLLGDEGNSEMTYKISLRAALLLESGLEERRKIKKIVKMFYDLRSKTVHGRTSGKKDAQENATCAEDGLDLCARVISDFVRNGKMPTMEDLELQPTMVSAKRE